MEFRLLSYVKEGAAPRAGLLVEDQTVLDVEGVLQALGAEVEGLCPTSVLSLLENWDKVSPLLREGGKRNKEGVKKMYLFPGVPVIIVVPDVPLVFVVLVVFDVPVVFDVLGVPVVLQSRKALLSGSFSRRVKRRVAKNRKNFPFP